jgi:serine phosphatase RsbU (regulator of sigma subunit)
LNKGIIKTLNQVECEQDDGMDMSICCIDKASRKISIALAGQTALLIQDGKPIIIPGAVFSIGGLMSNRDNVDFESHSFIITRNTQLYMFSDGFPDQVGGAEKKKFSTKQLTEILHENHRLPMLAQMDELSKELKGWTGKQNQVDDILVIGMKIPC